MFYGLRQKAPAGEAVVVGLDFRSSPASSPIWSSVTFAEVNAAELPLERVIESTLGS